MIVKTMFNNILPFIKYNVRSYSKKNVRVRFAPSPTGNLHLGGLRTALYNYLFTRSQNGKFILRIEDTDRKRTIPGATQEIIEDLKWCNLVPDEGPIVGGSFGPYIQSERQELYKEMCNNLIEKEAAYYCFCSEKRLGLLRKDALKRNLVPKYDNKCRNLTSDEIASKLSSDISKCIRFKLTDSKPFYDIVYGSVLHEVEDIEGDPVILKTDGWPTYHLANVVDDVSMNISHVIRGVEWLQSTNKHIMIYSALGYTPPQFAHLPLLLNADGSKFSKRHHHLSLQLLREKGVYPRTLLNFISHSSSGFPKKESNHNHSYSMEELINKFDLGSIGTTSNKLQFDRLNEFNRLEIKRQLDHSEELEMLVLQVKELVQSTFQKRKEELNLEREHIKKLLIWSHPRMSYLKDLVNKDLEFLWIKPIRQDLKKEDINMLKLLKEELNKIEFNDKKNLNDFLKNISQVNNIAFKELMMLMRNVISGLQNGPSVAEMLVLLGKSASLQRIEKALSSDGK